MTAESNIQISAPSPVRPQLWRWDIQRVPQLLIWKALLGLLLFDLLGLNRNFARMHRCVSGWRTTRRPSAAETVEHICAAVNYACVWYPKRVLCLQRSAVTTCILRHCGVSAKMVLGAQNLPFKAHAWTEVEGHAINERNDVQQVYSVLECC